MIGKYGRIGMMVLIWPLALAAEGPPPPEVAMAVAVRKTVTMIQELPGRVRAVRTAEVRARVEGIVEKRLFEEGSEVQAGAPLYRLDDRVLKAQMMMAEAVLEKTRASEALAKLTLDRQEALIKSQAVSRQQLDQVAAQHRQAQAEVAAARATLERQRLDLEYASITAPIAGRAGRSLVTEGALVGKGEATHLTTIEQLDPIRVAFTQASSDLMKLRKAMREGQVTRAESPGVQVILDDGQVYGQPGRLLFTEMAVDPQTGAVVLQAEFANPEQELLPGQFVRVRLETGRSEGITVPQRAVQTTPQGQAVAMVDGDNKVFSRPVKTGGFTGQEWVIREGVAEGERVIVDGLQKARPGTVVTPKP